MARRWRRWSMGGAIAIAALTGAIPITVPSALATSGRPVLNCPDSGCSAVFESGDGITVLSEQQTDQRLIELKVASTAVAGMLNVWVLLPSHFDPKTRYPVLYLFHGTSGTASDWVMSGGAERISSKYPMIIVMPDASLGGNGGSWCTNWVDQSTGKANWETFHVGELLPWVDANLPTTANREGRAIAGLSMGGFCSMTYAARHPDLFETAAAYSGAPDIAYDPMAELGAMSIINATEVGLNRVAPDSIFGDPATEQVNWAAHDPATLARNLAGTNLMLYTGNGSPGPLDPSPVSDPSSVAPTPGAAGIEWLVDQDNQMFHDRLDALDIPSYWDDYGAGTHTWPYWTRDLAQSLPTIMADFDDPRAPGTDVNYTTTDPVYSVYGWSVSVSRRVEEFSTLEDANSSGFSLIGSGSADVVTARDYLPGSRHVVRIARDATHAGDLTLTADAAGRLHVAVYLGPPNPRQEYTVPLLGRDPVQEYSGPVPIGTNFYETTVRVLPA